MTPSVSVVIPFYRGKGYLKEALQSVFEQTLSDIEVIVINDGSPEDISDIEAEYGSRAKFIRQANCGAANARNNGVDSARGDYVAFLDSDDIWLPQKLEKQIAHMEKHGFAWSHSAYTRFYEASDKTQYAPCNLFGYIYPLCFVWNPIGTPCVVVKRDILADNPEFRFSEGVKYGEDSALWRKIGIAHDLGHISEPLVRVRIRNSGALAQNAAFRASVQMKARGQIFPKIREVKKYFSLPAFCTFWIASFWCFACSKIADALPRKFPNFKELLSRALYLPAYAGFKALAHILKKKQRFRQRLDQNPLHPSRD